MENHAVPDVRAFLIVISLTLVVSGVVAVWAARWVPPEPAERSLRPTLLAAIGLAMAAVGVWFAWLATNATTFALSKAAMWTVVVIGVVALGVAVLTMARRPDRMGRRAVMLLVEGGLLLAITSALFAFEVPFRVRFHRSLGQVSLQAQQTWEDPPPALRADGVTERDDPTVIGQIGDFPVGQVGVTDCGPDFPHEGLSFWLGDSTTTALVWCPLGRPAADTRSTSSTSTEPGSSGATSADDNVETDRQDTFCNVALFETPPRARGGT